MDGCSKCCEINIVSLTFGSLPVLLQNNDTTIEKLVATIDVIKLQTSLNVHMPETKEVS